MPTALDVYFRRPRFMLDALCREYPELSWFPSRGETAAAALAVCDRCLVRDECAAHALAAGEHFGVWGGMSERQRRRERALDESVRNDPALVAERRAARVPSPSIVECGTEAGRWRHRARGEPVCDECKQARRDADRARRERAA